MKIGFISDTHGNIIWTVKALDILEGCDAILHLGDVLAHGPRNSITDGYNPKELAEILKKRDDIFYIRGNCDADVDEMVIEKDISKSQNLFEFENLKVYATHGYLESDEVRIFKAIELGADIVSYGHSHKSVLEYDEKDNLFILNPGSPSIPKDNTRSVAIYEDGTIKLINIENGNIIKSITR